MSGLVDGLNDNLRMDYWWMDGWSRINDVEQCGRKVIELIDREQ